MSPKITHLKDGTVRAEVASRRTFRKTVKYPQWQNECLAPSLLPQRRVCYVSGKEINVDCTAVKRVSKFVFFIYLYNSVLGLFWSFSIGARKSL